MMSAPDLKTLLRASADAARAHRNAARLLLQGIEDAAKVDSDALREFLVDAANFDLVAEVTAFGQNAEALIDDLTIGTTQAIFAACSRAQDKNSFMQKYEVISTEVAERVGGSCPCRGCSAGRKRAVKTVDACLRRISEKEGPR